MFKLNDLPTVKGTTLRFCFIYLSILFVAGTLQAQDNPGLFLHNKQNTRPLDLEKARQQIPNKYTDDLWGAYYISVPAEADTFMAFYVRIEYEEDDEYLPWMIIKRLSEKDQLWMLSPELLGELKFISYFKLRESGIIVSNDTPFLWLKHRTQHHSIAGQHDQVYILEPDSVIDAGIVPGFHIIDNESDELWPWKLNVFSESSPFKNTEEGAFMKRKVTLGTAFGRFNYTETYTVDEDTVRLYNSNEPDYFLSYLETDSLLQVTLDDYYSEKWTEQIKTEGGIKNRAENYLYTFADLTHLRADYAPAFYNKACMESLVGFTWEALQSLKKALELDPNYLHKALRDPDLEQVRQLPEFEEIITASRSQEK